MEENKNLKRIESGVSVPDIKYIEKVMRAFSADFPFVNLTVIIDINDETGELLPLVISAHKDKVKLKQIIDKAIKRVGILQ